MRGPERTTSFPFMLRGRTLPDSTWTRRHDGLLVVLALHLLGISAYVLATDSWNVTWEVALVAALALAGSARLPRSYRSVAVALGLFGSSAVIVHLSGGATEAHFHFFFVLALVSLYEDPVPYLVGIAFAFLEQFVVSALVPEVAFESEGHSLRWALVYAGFVAAVSVAQVVSWSSYELHGQRRRKELANEVNRLAAIVEGTDLAVLSMDLDGTVRSWNAGASRLFGYTKDEVLGQRVHILVPEDRLQELEDILRPVSAGQSRSCETVGRHRYHGSVEMAATFSPVRDTTDAVVGISLMARDISRQRQAERELAGSQEELAQLALHDSLTDLANRALFLDRLTHALRRPARGVIAVMVLDLDSFKLVNDSAGHPAGDALLKSVAGRLLAAVRESDTVARLGGDEFAVLLEEVEPSRAMDVAQKLVRDLAVPHLLGDRQFTTSVSIGLATSGGGGGMADELVRDADLAMYAAKAQGKGRLAVFDPSMHRAIMQRVEMEAALREGLERNELRLNYQPLVDTETGEIKSFEALVRWQHPSRGLIQPQQFIPLAEETGLIFPLSDWVLSETCAELRRMRASGRPDVRVAVNVAISQLEEGTLVDRVRKQLDEAGLPPELLVIEVTESALFQERGSAVKSLQQLRALGVKIAIDDFGTGYSSLGRLRSMPVDILKIDRTFIAELDRRGGQAPILAAVIAMAHSLELMVVAEGVETRDQYAALSRLGCDLAQGHLLGRPLPATELKELFAFRAPFAGLNEVEVVLDRQQGEVMSVVRDVIARAQSLEDLARPLLAVIKDVTGTDAAYLTVVDWQEGVQRVLYAHQGDRMGIREGASVPWDEEICRATLVGPSTAGGGRKAGRRLPSSCGVPVVRDDAVIVGTLCVAGGSIRHGETARRLMEFVARMLSDRMGESESVSRRPARVLIVDDSEVSRGVVSALLATSPLFEVVGQAADAAEGLALCEAADPDLVLLDMVMPGLDGLEVLDRIRARHPGMQVVALSASENQREAALSRGASAYVLKGTGLNDLLVTLTTVVSGRSMESVLA